MASQWPNIHFTTRVDMPEPVSQSLVREADFSATWKVAHGYIIGRPSSQKRGSWVRLLVPFQRVSESRHHKLHKTNDLISSIWPFQKVYLQKRRLPLMIVTRKSGRRPSQQYLSRLSRSAKCPK